MRCAWMLVLCSCQQLLGLDEPGALATDAAPAAHGRVYVIEPFNDAQHVASERVRPFHSASGVILSSGGANVPFAIDSDGRFDFVADHVPYRMLLVLDGIPTEITSSSMSLDLGIRMTHRYDAVTAAPGTVLNVKLSGVAPGGAPYVETTGVWRFLIRTSGSDTDFLIAWPAGLQLLDGMAGDRAYATWFEPYEAPNFGITRVCPADVTMRDGMTTTMTCTLTPVPRSRCVQLVANVATEDARVANALTGQPPATQTGAGWSINAVPAQDPALANRLLLAASLGTPSNVDIKEDYVAPFPGHDAAAAMTVTRLRSVKVGTASYDLGLVTDHVMKAPADCSIPIKLESRVAIPTAFSLDGTLLQQDGFQVVAGASPHQVSWSVLPGGQVDYFAVSLLDLTRGATTAYWYTTGTQITIDAPLLVIDHTYALRGIAVTGVPGAATGDFTTIAYPSGMYATAVRESPTFVVK
jgi:hypothetical protein